MACIDRAHRQTQTQGTGKADPLRLIPGLVLLWVSEPPCETLLSVVCAFLKLIESNPEQMAGDTFVYGVCVLWKTLQERGRYLHVDLGVMFTPLLINAGANKPVRLFRVIWLGSECRSTLSHFQQKLDVVGFFIQCKREYTNKKLVCVTSMEMMPL